MRCWTSSINRNIVECKYKEKQQIYLFREVLIETLWNVNKDFYGYRRKTVAVLIETLWNVNFYDLKINCLSAIVLIETLWNVNNLNCFSFHTAPWY